MQSLDFTIKISGFDMAQALDLAISSGANIQDAVDGGKLVRFADQSTVILKKQGIQAEAYTPEGTVIREQRLFRDTKTGALVQILEGHREPVIDYCMAGGGFTHSLKASEFEQRFKRAEPVKFNPVRVSGDWMPNHVSIPAFATEVRWNGWIQPYFSYQVACSMQEHLPDLQYDAEKDQFFCRVEGEDDYEFPAQNIVVDGKNLKAYGIGAGFWCWDDVPESPEPVEAGSDRPAAS